MASLIERVQKLTPAAALQVLVKEWAGERSNAIADVVDALDAQLAQPAFDGDIKAWLAAAKTVKVEERGPLFRAIKRRTGDDTLKMLDLAATWEDPRLTHSLRDLLATLPWAGARSRAVWRNVFAVLARHGDPRWLAIAPALPPSWNVGKPLQVWLTRQLADATGHLQTRAADDEAALAAWAAELRANAPKPALAPHSGEALLAAIYGNPDDDTARLVYADWLLERDDPRGELIALQCKADPASKRREHQLLNRYKKAWVGPLANVLRGEVEFRRGFPARGVATFRHQRDVEQWGSLVEWATLEEIEYSHTIVRDDQMEWAHFIGPAMIALRVAHRPTVAHLLAATKPWRLETLEIDGRVKPNVVSALASSPLLPRLKTLQMFGWECKPDSLANVKKCPPHLWVSESLDGEDVASWLSAARNTEAETFSLRQYGGFDHTFSRDQTGAFTRLDIVVRPPTPIQELAKTSAPLPVLVKALRQSKLPSTHLSIRVEVAGVLVDATDVIRPRQ